MPAAGRSVDVLCPLYRKNYGVSIGCEGLTDDSTVTMQYRNKAGCMQQMDIFCCNRYKNCELYEAIMKAKYADFMESN